jgi:hypothetical protein
MIKPRMLMAIWALALVLPPTPGHATERSCSTAATSATNITVGDLISQGDSPSCSMSFLCRSDRADCKLTAVGSVTGPGLVGVGVIVGESAMAECWVGPGTCTTEPATRTIAQGDTVTVTCAFRNGISPEAVVSCAAELT